MFQIARVVVAAALFFAPAHQGAATFQLSTVTVKGMKRFASADVVRLSGLEIGKQVGPPDLDAAMDRLVSTGLFSSANYNVTTAAGKLNATLEIVETPWTLPVVFDNFVWFSDQELAEAVKQKVPTFDGTLPANDAVIEYVSRALQQLLDARHIQGRATGESRSNLKTGVKQQLFTVSGMGAALKMCALHIQGAAGVPEADLVKVAQSVIGTDYSRAFVDGLATGTLRQEYRRHGYWAADVTYQSASIDQGCPGITVAFASKEGAPYTFERAEWSGTTAIATGDLDKALALKSGELAEITRLEGGLRSVHAAYEKIGYILQDASYSPVLDDAAHRVTFQIAVKEQQQYRMGTLTFPDLQPADADKLIKKWKLAAGDVYDGSYLGQYTFGELRAAQNSGSAPRNLRSEIAVDRQALRVNVRFVVPR